MRNAVLAAHVHKNISFLLYQKKAEKLYKKWRITGSLAILRNRAYENGLDYQLCCLASENQILIPVKGDEKGIAKNSDGQNLTDSNGSHGHQDQIL